jgi:hypothetical protein
MEKDITFVDILFLAYIYELKRISEQQHCCIIF